MFFTALSYAECQHAVRRFVAARSGASLPDGRKKGIDGDESAIVLALTEVALDSSRLEGHISSKRFKAQPLTEAQRTAGGSGRTKADDDDSDDDSVGSLDDFIVVDEEASPTDDDDARDRLLEDADCCCLSMSMSSTPPVVKGRRKFVIAD
jgi:hypothetical protein